MTYQYTDFSSWETLCIYTSTQVASKNKGVQEVQQLVGSYTVLFYFTVYIIICTHTELLNDIGNTVVISCYSLMFKPYKKNLLGKKSGTLCS